MRKVGSGRILVRVAGGGLAILRPNGSVPRRLDFPGKTLLDAVLEGSQLALLEPRSLELYSLPNDRLLHSYRLSPIPG